MYKSIEKLRRAPHPVRQRLTALITILAVGVITVVWFIFFVWSLITSTKQVTDVAPVTAGVEVDAEQSTISE